MQPHYRAIRVKASFPVAPRHRHRERSPQPVGQLPSSLHLQLHPTVESYHPDVPRFGAWERFP